MPQSGYAKFSDVVHRHPQPPFFPWTVLLNNLLGISTFILVKDTDIYYCKPQPSPILVRCAADISEVM